MTPIHRVPLCSMLPSTSASKLFIQRSFGVALYMFLASIPQIYDGVVCGDALLF